MSGAEGKTLTVRRRGRPWSAVPDHILTDGRLTMAARVAAAYCLGRPDGWVFRVGQVQRALGMGRDAWRAARVCLMRAGYMTHRRLQGDAGRWIWVLDIYDEPATMDGFSGDGEPVAGESVAGQAGHITVGRKQTECKQTTTPRAGAVTGGGEVVVAFGDGSATACRSDWVDALRAEVGSAKKINKTMGHYASGIVARWEAAGAPTTSRQAADQRAETEAPARAEAEARRQELLTASARKVQEEASRATPPR